MMNAILYDVPDLDYREAEGVSNSQLASMVISPKQFDYDLKHPRKPTDAFLWGLILDHGRFTPDRPEWWTVIPEGLNLATKKGRAWKKAQASGAILIHWADMERIKGMLESLRSHPDVQKALGTGKPQVSVFWDHRTDGKLWVQRKARMDWVSDGDSIVDLKSCLDARKEAFEKSIYEFGYHRQAATYLDGWNAAVKAMKPHFGWDHTLPTNIKTNFVLVAVEKEPPHDLQVWYLKPEAIERGREENRKLLNLYAECKANNDWPGYEPGIKPIGLPQKAYPRTEWITQ